MKKLGIILAVVIVLTAALTLCVACGEKASLSYATWNLGTETGNNVERQMVKAFEEAYGVKVELKDIPLTGYSDGIKGAIGRNDAPDVFMTDNINFLLNNQYAMDITDLIKDDADWAKIPTALEESTHYKSGTYAIPFAMHMLGFFVNVELLDEYNIDLPSNGAYTWDWFVNAVKEISNHKSDGVIGLNEVNHIFEWYASALNKDLGYFTWDGSSYHLDGEEFKQAMATTKELHTAKVAFDSLSEEERLTYFDGYDGWTSLWDEGKMAFRWGYTYEMPDMVSKNPTANIKFIGMPYVENAGENARTENFVTLVPDYVAIYRGCQNPELAYEFAKWMSFDPAGIRKRIELDKSTGVTNTLPLSTDSSIIDAYFDKFDAIGGFHEMYTKLDDAILEPIKVTPGYEAARFNATTGKQVGDSANAKIGVLLDACWYGDLTYADYSKACEELANKQYANAVKSYEGKYK